MKTKFNTPGVKRTILFFVLSLLSVTGVSALTPGTVESPLMPVPAYSIVYQSITASVTEKSVILDWNTAYEFQNSHFEVERSSDMKDFKTVALVLDGFSTEGSGKRYAFKEDNGVLKNGRVVYYRLKQFDIYGKISYSGIIRVQQTKKS